MLKVIRKDRGTSNQWRYIERQSGATFYSRNYWDLETAVYKHRLAMGYDTAEGWQERFQDDLCKQNPTVICNRPKIELPRITVADVTRFIKSMLGWSGGFVDQAEADKRASICATCPLQIQVRGCWSCTGVMAMLKILIGNRKTASDNAITGACSLCKCSLRGKVWFPKEAINTDGLEPPEHCWMRD